MRCEWGPGGAGGPADRGRAGSAGQRGSRHGRYRRPLAHVGRDLGRQRGPRRRQKGEAIWTNYEFDDYGIDVDGFTSMTQDVFIAIMSPHVYPDAPLGPGTEEGACSRS